MFERTAINRVLVPAIATCLVAGGLVVFAVPAQTAPQVEAPSAEQLAAIHARTEKLHQSAAAAMAELDEDATASGTTATTPGQVRPKHGLSAAVTPEEAVKLAGGGGQVHAVSVIEREPGKPIYQIQSAQGRTEVDATTGEVRH